MGSQIVFGGVMQVILSFGAGYVLYKLIMVKHTPLKPNDYGRKWAAWGVFAGTLASSPKFFRELTLDHLAQWVLIGIVLLGIAAYIFGWCYGKFFKNKSANESSTTSLSKQIIVDPMTRTGDR